MAKPSKIQILRDFTKWLEDTHGIVTTSELPKTFRDNVALTIEVPVGFNENINVISEEARKIFPILGQIKLSINVTFKLMLFVQTAVLTKAIEKEFYKDYGRTSGWC